MIYFILNTITDYYWCGDNHLYKFNPGIENAQGYRKYNPMRFIDMYFLRRRYPTTNLVFKKVMFCTTIPTPWIKFKRNTKIIIINILRRLKNGE